MKRGTLPSYFGVFILGIIGSNFLFNSLLFQESISGALSIINKLLVVLGLGYPLLILSRICNQTSPYLPHLPYSNRQLLVKGLKSWFIAYPLYLTVAPLLIIILQNFEQQGAFIERIMNQYSVVMMIVFIFAPIVLQMMIGMIRVKSELIRWSIVMGGIIIGIVVFILAINLYPKGIFIFFITYLLSSSFLFINSLKGFGKIHQ